MSQVLALECKWLLKDKSCSKKARLSGFCGKHEPRAILLEQAKKDGRRICDDAKRACKNYTDNNKLNCEECLEKNRLHDNKKYEERKNTLNMCLGCGTTIPELLDGILGHKVQRCQSCYTKLREVEENRSRTRNYAAENMANLDKHYVNYIKGAGIRNMEFDIPVDKFKEMVQLPCHYCNSYTENEVIGIDRMNSSIHYTVGNCVPCCSICNTLKNTMSKHEFISQIHKIAKNFKVYDSDDESESESESTRVLSMIPPKKVVELYRYGKFDDFIEACEKDNRDQSFIERLKTVDKKMTNLEFKKWFRTCCAADAKSTVAKKNIKQRRQVLQKDIYALLNTKSVKLAIDTYVSVHGVIPGFKDEIEHLSNSWETLSFDERTLEIKKIMIKYRNIRGYAASKQSISKTEPAQVQATPVQAPVSNTELTDNQNILVCTPESTVNLQSTLYPTQWKISNIYRNLISGNHTPYLTYLQENNKQTDLEEKLNTLIVSIKDKTKEDAELLIKKFIEDLRTIRHNALCYSKNNALLLREDREHWNSQSVLRAFSANMLTKFKEHTEANTGESADDPVWSKRWTSFVESVSNEIDVTKKKDLIQKFLTAQRTKKYRKSKCSTHDS